MSSRRTSSFSVHWAATAALLSVLSADLVQLGMAQSAFNCSVVCFSNYFASFPRDCEVINYALRCYNDHLSDCESSGTSASLTQVENDHDTMNCPPWDTPTEAGVTTEPITTAPPPSCPAAPVFTGTYSPTFAAADVHPVVTNPDCIEYDPQLLQHCSLFGYSTLRPFSSYRSGFEACHIPGSWFLLRHRTVSVEVEGVANGENGDHTKLSKVNVTFYRSGSCLGETKSYVATFDSSLPQTFSDLTLPSNCSANLQLQVNQEGTLATLMAPWINTTIVIRRFPGSDILAVTLQVPGRLGFESDGLCRGCPVHSHLNISQFIAQMQTIASCVSQASDIIFNCYVSFSFLDNPEFYSVLNVSYPDMCWYSLWRHSSDSKDFLGFLIAVGSDAKLLQDQGSVPRRAFEIIAVDNPDSSDSLCYPSSETNSTETTEAVGTTDTTDSIDMTDIDSRTTTSAKTNAASTTVSQRTTTQRAQTDLSTTESTSNVEMISSSTGNHQRRCTMPSLFALSILSAFGVRLLLR